MPRNRCAPGHRGRYAATSDTFELSMLSRGDADLGSNNRVALWPVFEPQPELGVNLGLVGGIMTYFAAIFGRRVPGQLPLG